MRGMRALALLICAAMLALMLGGCEREHAEEKDDGVLNIYASFYPLYAITQMLAEGVPEMQVSCLVQPQDGCLRDYELSDWDLALLTRSADAVIIGGRGLESFESLLYSLGEDGPAVSAVLYNMDLSSYSTDEAGEDSHWNSEYLNIYLKTDGARQIAERIAGSLMIYDPENREKYEENLEKLDNRLKSVCEEIQTLVGFAVGEPVIVMNEAFVYTAEECGLQIERCVDRDSGEAYYDAELERCIEELKACEARVILIERQAPTAFCRALEEAGFRLARLDTLSTHDAGEDSNVYINALIANAYAVTEAFTETNSEVISEEMERS